MSIDESGGAGREEEQGGRPAEKPAAPAGRCLGAHVSVAGGLARALERAAEIEATAVQIFTDQPQRWAQRVLTHEEVVAFRSARSASDVEVLAAHDSYLINLASPRPGLFEKSEAAFRAELERCARLGVDHLVTHPGNATAGDRAAALRRNARAVGAALAEHPGPTRVLFETTAGTGTALGWRFEELATLIREVPEPERGRVGVCLDTCHLHAAGYDLGEAYEQVLGELEATVGIDRVGLLHLNDSRHPLGSRKDRHAHIGEGHVGEAAFSRLLRDERLRAVPRILETPKGDDPPAADRRNLDRLRELAGRGSS